MSLIKKLVIFLLVVGCIIIIVNLIIQRKYIYKSIDYKEGMLSQSTELGSVEVHNNSIAVANVQNPSLALSQYCIKSSYNSALTGNYINTDMIKYVLSRGCRFLDFEVYSLNSVPCVAYSTDNTFSSINTQNSIPLSRILSTVGTYGFMAPSPNPTDPLFVHLRIKSTEKSIYSQIAKNIDATIKSLLYSDSSGKIIKVKGDTMLKDLVGKIVVVVDRSLAPNYATSFNSNCPDPANKSPGCYYLADYVHMESGGDTVRKYSYSNITSQMYSTPNIMDDGIRTDVKSMKMVTPDLITNIFGMLSNPPYYSIPINYGVQIMAYPFYIVDSNLGGYESVFSNFGKAFVPLSDMIRYINSAIYPSNVNNNAKLLNTPALAPAPMGLNINKGPLPIILPIT
jgi:hypothetical protein